MIIAMRVSFEVPDLAQKINLACKLTDKTLKQVCDEAGISTQFLYDLRKGRTTAFRFETLKKLEKALDTDFDLHLPKS